MAGRGAPPSQFGLHQSGRNVRGGWRVVDPLTSPVLPPMPDRTQAEGPWSDRARASWEGMRADPATGIFGPPEIALAIELAYLIEDAVRSPKTSLLTEIRLRRDSLGLTPKGKRDLRLIVGEPPPPERPAAPKRLGSRERFGHLMPVDPSLITTTPTNGDENP